jgi:ribonucleoside-diphosphate reductase alpha chain
MKKIKSIRKVGTDHTWDLSVDGEEYLLPNGVVSHNTSAQIANATNGIEPPRAFVSIKQSKDGVLAQVVPKYEKLKNKYELLWDQKSPIGYLKICAILQKYIDQAISVNTSYNPKFYPEEQIPMSELMQHLLLFYKWGGKNLYYSNVNDQAGEIDVNKIIDDPLTEDESCDGCKI